MSQNLDNIIEQGSTRTQFEEQYKKIPQTNIAEIIERQLNNMIKGIDNQITKLRNSIQNLEEDITMLKNGKVEEYIRTLESKKQIQEKKLSELMDFYDELLGKKERTVKI